MIAKLLARARSSGLLQGSAWILVGLAIQALLGFVFWLLGARVASSSELGQATALFTAILLLTETSEWALSLWRRRRGAMPTGTISTPGWVWP